MSARVYKAKPINLLGAPDFLLLTCLTIRIGKNLKWVGTIERSPNS